MTDPQDETAAQTDHGGTIGRTAAPAPAADQTLAAETKLLGSLFMQSPRFVCLLRGPEHVFQLVNEAFLRLVGDRGFIGRSVREVMNKPGEVDGVAILDTVFRSGEPYGARQMKIRLHRHPAQEPTEYFLDFVCQPVRGATGAVEGIFVEGSDVTEHVRAEERQALLIRELHHRVRNTLATVQGVMNSTARTSETIEEYQAAFTGRISALARTHALLTEELQQSVPLLHLFTQELEPFAEGERVRLKGPWINLPSQIAVPLAMTIHELTTNAAKHGALANATGRLDIEWELVNDQRGRAVRCSWQESEGPAVTSPAREGFGSMLLNRVLMQQIGAEIKTAYDPSGFQLSMRLPLDPTGK